MIKPKVAGTLHMTNSKNLLASTDPYLLNNSTSSSSVMEFLRTVDYNVM